MAVTRQAQNTARLVHPFLRCIAAPGVTTSKARNQLGGHTNQPAAGLGTDNMVAVDTDEGGRLLPKALETAIEAALEQGKVDGFAW